MCKRTDYPIKVFKHELILSTYLFIVNLSKYLSTLSIYVTIIVNVIIYLRERITYVHTTL